MTKDDELDPILAIDTIDVRYHASCGQQKRPPLPTQESECLRVSIEQTKSNIKTFEEWKKSLDGHPCLGTYKVYKATPFESWAWKHVPYWCCLPLTKRQRVILRKKLRYAWVGRANKDMVKALQGVYNDKTIQPAQPFKIEEDEWSWTITTQH